MTTTTSTPVPAGETAASAPGEAAPAALPRLLEPEHLARVEGVYLDLVRNRFPFETRIAHSLAYLRTYAAPRIAGLLAHTGHVQQAPEKRAVDTGLHMYELFHHGLDSPTGLEIVRRMNGWHQHWKIRNEDYVWTLGTFAVIGTQVIDRYAWRRLTEDERQAGVDWWRELGTRMGITDIPETYPEFADVFREYEERTLRRSEAGQKLMAASWPVAMTQLPAPVRPLGRHLFAALTDEPARSALGLPKLNRLVTATVTSTLMARSILQRDAQEGSGFVPGAPIGPYKDGYTLDDLGVGEDHVHPAAGAPS